MKKKNILLMLIMILTLFVTGCTTKYEKKDIKKYIENDIGIKKYKLDNKATSKKGDDGYTDYYWHVKYENIEFDVIDDYRWGSETLINGLESNFDIKVLDYYYNKYDKKSKIIYKKDYIYDENKLICEVADEQKIVDELKLQQCYNSNIEFIKTIDFNKYPIKYISVEVTNKNEHVNWLHILEDYNIKSFDEFNEKY